MSLHTAVPLRQRGAILVTSMLLLLVLTVLGVAMMRMTNMQERMAGNTRDINLALQAAEAGLRDAETSISPGVLSERPFATGFPGCLASVCGRAELPVDIENPDSFDWTAARELGAQGVQDINDGTLAEDPRYAIEEAGFVRDSLVTGNEPETGFDYYTVTSRSTGRSGQTNTVLQSTYSRRF
jgi:type IV pilus assembly protein PilX